MTEFLEMMPMASTPILAWCVWRIHALEQKIFSEIKSDIEVLKNDVKWLVDHHNKED